MKKILAFVSLLGVLQDGQAQNVGIGTASPSEKLHVAGNIKADTLKTAGLKLAPGAGAGKVLTSDAAGNASWQATANASSNHNGNIGNGVWGDCQTNAVISEYQLVTDTPYDAGGAFGYSVAISGSYAIVGAPLNDEGMNSEQGSASIFYHDGTKWTFMQKLVDINGQPYDHFGFRVSISGQFAVVGAPTDDVGANSDQGSVSVFKLNGSSWVSVNQLTDASGAADDWFGCSVCISGTTIIVGAERDDVGANIDQGSASIYSFTGANWVLANKLTAAAGKSDDHFGRSVAISGLFAVVGAADDDIGSNVNQGSAKVYHKVGPNWTFFVSLTDLTGAPGSSFGTSVAISGQTLIVGAPNEPYDTIVARGSASIFGYDGTAWVLQKKLVQINAVDFEYFGSSVTISGNYAIVGCRGHDLVQGYDAGSATLYLRVGSTWAKHQFITDPRAEEAMTFGSGVAIDGLTKRFCIGGGIGGFLGIVKSNKAFFGKVY